MEIGLIHPQKTFFNFFQKPPCALPQDVIHLRQFKDQTRPTMGVERSENPNKPRVRLREKKRVEKGKTEEDSDICGKRHPPEIGSRPQPKNRPMNFSPLPPREIWGRKGNEK